MVPIEAPLPSLPQKDKGLIDNYINVHNEIDHPLFSCYVMLCDDAIVASCQESGHLSTIPKQSHICHIHHHDCHHHHPS